MLRNAVAQHKCSDPWFVTTFATRLRYLSRPRSSVASFRHASFIICCSYSTSDLRRCRMHTDGNRRGGVAPKPAWKSRERMTPTDTEHRLFDDHSPRWLARQSPRVDTTAILDPWGHSFRLGFGIQQGPKRTVLGSVVQANDDTPAFHGSGPQNKNNARF